jgi:hypothetical protein
LRVKCNYNSPASAKARENRSGCHSREE